MRAVVTGGAGFIGSTLVDVLVGRGDTVTVVDSLVTVTKADRGFIMLLEGGKPVFKIGRTWNRKDGAAKKTFKLDETQFFFSKTIVNRRLRMLMLINFAGQLVLELACDLLRVPWHPTMALHFVDLALNEVRLHLQRTP